VAPGVDIAYVVDDYTDGWVEAPVVMLLHGIAESAEAFAGWVPRLARRCQVVRVDLRGYGLSSPVGEHDMLSIAEMADDIDALAGRLGRPIHVVGAKLGAQVALELAQRGAPWMASLTLDGPAWKAGRGPPCPDAWAARWRPRAWNGGRAIWDWRPRTP
jgi:pimeloyl-ACP methyl ester carboxylesterase